MKNPTAGSGSGSGAGSDSGADPRLKAVEAILAREGIPGRASVAGQAGDVAALTVPPEHLARLAELAPEVKALGFRYVALELQAEA